MSALYLIRHGQAGSRNNYDTLSETGRTQSRLLGEYLAAQGIRFRAVYSGALERQRQTADEVRRTCPETIPEIIVNSAWNEFDLGAVYEAVGPQLSADDPEFRQAYEKLTDGDRHWTPCDIAVVQAWIEERYPFDGESWRQFQDRIARAVASLREHRSGEAIAVFTSATPIAIVVSMALGITGGMTVKLAGVTYNSAITTLRLQPHDLTLFHFNGIPHLREPQLRTFR